MIGPAGRWLWLPLLLMVLTAIIGLPGQVANLRAALPVIRLWSDGHAQHRLQLGDVPYDLLQAADATLPADRPLLLVTSGRDVRRFEYITYHRALYFLAPRPVWWLSPAPSDGSWESRWWISSPLSAEAIRAVAAEKGAPCLLAVGVSLPATVGQQVAPLPGGSIWQLDGGRDGCAGVESRSAATAAFAGRGWPLQLAAALAVILVIGYGLLAMVTRLGYRARGIEAAALAWILGAGLLSLAMLAFNGLGFSLSAQRLVLTGLALMTAVCLLWRSPHAVRSQLTEKRPRIPLIFTNWSSTLVRIQEIWGGFLNRSLALRLSGLNHHPLLLTALFLFLSGQVAYVILLAMGRPFVIWDSWVNWGIKGRIIFLENGITAAVYGDASRAVALLDYPLFVPLLEAWLFRWLGAADDRLAGVLFVLFYLALAGVIYSAVRRSAGSATFALLVTVAGVSLGHVVGLAAAAFTDLLLTVLAATTAVYLLDWLDGGRPGPLVIAAVAGGLLPWSKREGLILVAVVCLVTLIVTQLSCRPAVRSRGRSAVGALALATAVLAGPWWLFAGRYAIAIDQFLPLTAGTWWSGLARLPVIGWLMVGQLFNMKFSIAWLLPFLAGWLAWRCATERSTGKWAANILPLTALLYVGLMGSTYLFSDFVPFQQHVLASVFRLGSQVVILPVLWLPYGARRGDLIAGPQNAAAAEPSRTL